MKKVRAVGGLLLGLGALLGGCTLPVNVLGSGGSSSAPPATPPPHELDAAAVQAYCSAICDWTVPCLEYTTQEGCQSSCRDEVSSRPMEFVPDVRSEADSCVRTFQCDYLREHHPAVELKCLSAVQAEAPPTTGEVFCDSWAKADLPCGRALDKPACLAWVKQYPDDAVAAASYCLSRACDDVIPCINAALPSM